MGFDYFYIDGEKACESEPLKVLLDGRPYGEIRKVETGYQHFSEGYWHGGEIFKTVSGVQSRLCTLRLATEAREIDKMKTDMKEVNEKLVRAKILLTAVYDLFGLQEDSEDVLDLLEESVAYDNTDCVGHDLFEDIQKLLESME